MKKVVTWIADDGEKFPTMEQCYAYEHRFDDAKDAVIFLDEEFRPIPFNLEKIYDDFIYMVIRDEEKAKALFWAIHEWERCFEAPLDYHTGDIIAWDAWDEGYVDLKEEYAKIGKKLSAIEKAVSEWK